MNLRAKGCNISVSIPAADFPADELPSRGAPGSAKARLPLTIETADGMVLNADIPLRTLHRAADAAAETDGGFFILQGRLASGGRVLDGGLTYSPPKAPAAAPVEPPPPDPRFASLERLRREMAG